MEDNVLIAEFMGGKYTYGNLTVPLQEGLIYIPLRGGLEIKNIKYDSDWNWLMEVVERIECDNSIEFAIAQKRVNISHNSDNSTETFIIVDITTNKIEAVYKAVIEFIEWYNEQTK